MKETVYRCDICEECEDHLEAGTLIGLYTGADFYSVPLDGTDKHICLKCIDKLTELKKKLDAGEE